MTLAHTDDPGFGRKSRMKIYDCICQTRRASTRMVSSECRSMSPRRQVERFMQLWISAAVRGLWNLFGRQYTVLSMKSFCELFHRLVRPEGKDYETTRILQELLQDMAPPPCHSDFVESTEKIFFIRQDAVHRFCQEGVLDHVPLKAYCMAPGVKA